MIRLKSIQTGSINFDLDCGKQHENFTYKDTTLSKATLVLGENKDRILLTIYDALFIIANYLQTKKFSLPFFKPMLSLQDKVNITFAADSNDLVFEIDIKNEEVKPTTDLKLQINFAYITNNNVVNHFYILKKRGLLTYLRSLLKDFNINLGFNSDDTIAFNGEIYNNFEELIKNNNKVKGIIKGLIAVIYMQLQDNLVLLDELDNGIDYETLEELLVRFLKTTNGRIIATSNNAELLQNKDLFSLCNIQIHDGNNIYKLNEIDGIETVDDLYKAYTNGKLGGVPDYTRMIFDQFIDETK